MEMEKHEIIKEHILAAMEKKWPGAKRERDFLDFLLDGKTLYEEDMGGRRWWNDVFRVTEIDGMLVGYGWANTTGDDSARDKGWEFDPESLCEVEPHTETITRTTYKAKV